MRYLLDANSVIYLLAGSFPSLTSRVAATPAGDIGISSIAYAEVAMGSFRGKPPALRLLTSFTREIPVLPFDQTAAETYAELDFQRGSFDRLIAAHALALGSTVITRNTPDFQNVPGLKVENWTLPL